MADLNQLQILMALKNGNPQQVAQQIIQQNFPNDPMMQQLMQLALNNDTQNLNKFAEQFFAKRGLDFTKELGNLMSTLRNM